MTSEKVIDENTWRRQECRKFIAEVMEVLHIPPIYYSITERGMGGVYAKSALPFRVQFDGVGRGIIEPNSIYTNIKSAIKYAYKENYIQRKMVKVDYFKSQMHLNRSVWGRMRNGGSREENMGAIMWMTRPIM